MASESTAQDVTFGPRDPNHCRQFAELILAFVGDRPRMGLLYSAARSALEMLLDDWLLNSIGDRPFLLLCDSISFNPYSSNSRGDRLERKTRSHHVDGDSLTVDVRSRGSMTIRPLPGEQQIELTFAPEATLPLLAVLGTAVAQKAMVPGEEASVVRLIDLAATVREIPEVDQPSILPRPRRHSFEIAITPRSELYSELFNDLVMTAFDPNYALLSEETIDSVDDPMSKLFDSLPRDHEHCNPLQVQDRLSLALFSANRRLDVRGRRVGLEHLKVEDIAAEIKLRLRDGAGLTIFSDATPSPRLRFRDLPQNHALALLGVAMAHAAYPEDPEVDIATIISLAHSLVHGDDEATQVST